MNESEKSSTMTEQSMENQAILQKWLLKSRSKDDTEKEEISMQDEAGEHDCSTVSLRDALEENIKESKPVDGDKEKQARIQSAFSMVRSQIRTQAALDGQRMGILDVINQVKELERSKREQEEPTPIVKISSFEEDEVDQGTQTETLFEENDNKGKEQEVCVALLEEVLLSLESLKKDLREGLAQLRRETQSYTERELCGLETRLTNLLRMQTPSALPMKTKKQRTPSMPPLGTSRRRILNRTMTTITPKTCLPLSLGPRSNSEPMGVFGTETATSNGTRLRRRGEMLNQPPPGPLPPAQPSAQTSKKTLRSRTRIGKPTS